MFRQFTNAAIVAASLFAFESALAANVTLERDFAAGVINEAGVDMVVYTVDHDGDAEIVATYVVPQRPAQPQRLVMRLAEQENVEFALPGRPGLIFAFSHDHEGVHVASRSTAQARSQVQVSE